MLIFLKISKALKLILNLAFYSQNRVGVVMMKISISIKLLIFDENKPF